MTIEEIKAHALEIWLHAPMTEAVTYEASTERHLIKEQIEKELTLMYEYAKKYGYELSR